MSVRWDCTKVKDYAQNFPDHVDEKGNRHWNLITYALVWECIRVDMGKITDKNWEEFYLRTRMYAAFEGEIYLPGLLPEHVKGHIGMTVNVSTLTKRQFEVAVIKRLRDEAQRRIDRQAWAKVEAAEKLAESREILNHLLSVLPKA